MINLPYDDFFTIFKSKCVEDMPNFLPALSWFPANCQASHVLQPFTEPAFFFEADTYAAQSDGFLGTGLALNSASE